MIRRLDWNRKQRPKERPISAGVVFDGFTNTDGAAATVNDGEVIFGRLGILLEREASKCSDTVAEAPSCRRTEGRR